MIAVEAVPDVDPPSRASTAIFALICAIPVFATVVFGGVDNAAWMIIDVLWAVLVLLWCRESWSRGGFVLSFETLQLPILGLIVIGIVQSLPLGLSSTEALSVGTTRALSLDPYATRFFVARSMVYATFFAACLAFIDNEKRFKRILFLIVSFASLMAFFGILQWLANPDGIYGLRGTPQARPFGPFVNQHHFAAFMIMAGGVALGLLLGTKTSRDRRIVLALALVVMGVAAVLTSSRGGTLGFVTMLAGASMATYFFGRQNAGNSYEMSRSGNAKLIVAGVAVMVAVLFIALAIGGNESLFRGLGISNADADLTSGRSRFWPIAIKIFLDHPVLGAGFDAFGAAFTKYDTSSGAFRVEQAHNEYLQILADAGIAGFLCIAAFIGLFFKKGIAAVKNAGTGMRRDAAIGALAGIVGVLVHSFFDFPLRTPSNAFFFLLLCAIAVVPVKIGHRNHHRHRPTT